VYLKLANPQAHPHHCWLPGWWRRWRDGVRDGAIWQCECGLKYEYRPWEIVYGGVYRAGQNTAPWWPILPPLSQPSKKAIRV